VRENSLGSAKIIKERRESFYYLRQYKLQENASMLRQMMDRIFFLQED